MSDEVGFDSWEPYGVPVKVPNTQRIIDKGPLLLGHRPSHLSLGALDTTDQLAVLEERERFTS